MESPFTHWYDNATVVHPLGLAALLILTGALLALPRRLAFLPLLLLAALIPAAQRIVIAGLDFTFLRLLIVAGFVRVLARGEHRGLRWTPLDSALVAYTLVEGLVYLARMRSGPSLTLQLGVTFDVFGMYFLMRMLVRGWQDIDRLALSAILVSIPTAAFFLVEAQTGRNPFSALGGVPVLTVIREGKLRCSGAFGNSILAGCFWASLIPLMVARGLRANRPLAGLGVCCALIVVITCASSTPIMGLLFGAVGTALYPLRFELRWVRRGLSALLVFLHIVMKAPVWHLISRIDVVGGSSGYHRYNLIDKFIQNFRDWWLLGTNSTGGWAWGLHDVANQFVAAGVRGGLAGFVAFIVLLVQAFKQTGLTLRSVRNDRTKTAYAYALGICLLMHIGMFFGVSYWGQIEVVFYANLAAVGSLAAMRLDQRATLPAPESPEPVLRERRPATQVSPAPAGSTLAGGLLGRRVR
jgi:hypothetical protein